MCVDPIDAHNFSRITDRRTSFYMRHADTAQQFLISDLFQRQTAGRIKLSGVLRETHKNSHASIGQTHVKFFIAVLRITTIHTYRIEPGGICIRIFRNYFFGLHSQLPGYGTSKESTFHVMHIVRILVCLRMPDECIMHSFSFHEEPWHQGVSVS